MKSFIRITASLLAALTVLLSFNTAAYALGIEDAYHHGDVTLDNKIDVTDATAIQKYAVALAEFSPEQLSKADVNYDGVINVADATLIQKIASGFLCKRGKGNIFLRGLILDVFDFLSNADFLCSKSAFQLFTSKSFSLRFLASFRFLL